MSHVLVLGGWYNISQYSPLHSCFYGNRWVLFSIYWQEVVDSVSYTIGSCTIMFPVNDLDCSVNYVVCLLITYLVYSVNYLVCLLITIRTNWVGEYHIIMLVWDLWFTITTMRQRCLVDQLNIFNPLYRLHSLHMR